MHKLFQRISGFFIKEAVMSVYIVMLFLAFSTTYNLPVSSFLTVMFLILTSVLLLMIPVMDIKRIRHKIVTGTLLILSGTVVTLYGILPHFIVAAYDKSVIAKIEPGFHPSTPVLLAIPPISYWVIGIGVVIFVTGMILIASRFVISEGIENSSSM
ncbi:hypothetical protein IX51_11060 [uncultured archaeon]|nr:hypothetical protein IX51_11060 [uncultured archaeon]